MPLNRDATYELYEYACHEGNYGLENSLSGGRAEDRAAAGQVTKWEDRPSCIDHTP